MRRRRHQLQVSTFPFLAVLLCAMGSLILLLLVIDRRAKEAAREKALRAYRQSTSEQEQQEAARKAELERQSQELHARLRHANDDLLAQVHATETDVQAAQRRLDEARHQYVETRSRMASAVERLKQDQTRLGLSEAEVHRAAQTAETNRKALARLEAELRELEQTVIDLKLARQRQTQTYSLMPYRGRQGDIRRPLYVECTAGGYVFHPDRLSMSLVQVRLADIRAEVQRRLARLRESAHGDAKKPYVMLLVRPDGVESYYVLIRALDGLGLDFGYEFVERDWVLDFQNESVLGNQPWMAEATPAAPPRADLQPLDLRHRSHAKLGGAFTFGAPTDGTGRGGSGGTGGPGHGSGGGTGRTGGAGHGAGGGPGGTNLAGTSGATGTASGIRGPADSGGGKPFAMLGTPIGSAPGIGSGARPPGGAAAASGVSSAGTHGNAVGGFGGSNAGTPGQANPGSPPSGVAGLGFGQPTGGGSPTGNGQAASAGATSPPRGLNPSQAGSTVNQSGGTAGPGNGQPASAGANSPQLSVNPSQAGSTASQPGGAAGSNPPNGSNPGVASTDPAGLSAGGSPSGAASGDGAGAGSGPTMLARPDPLAGIGPTQNKPRRPVVRPAMLRANRDWIIGLECRGTEIILHPGQKSFAVAALEDGSSATALASTLRDLIARRQASVLPGQPPYRPLLRFLVWPNGLRGYYDAYPLLEGLRLPMGRVDIHSNDELRRALYPGA